MSTRPSRTLIRGGVRVVVRRAARSAAPLESLLEHDDRSAPLPVGRIAGHPFDFARHIAVMAIVNRTPTRSTTGERLRARRRGGGGRSPPSTAGAELVDVGGVKFAPGPPVPVAEEIARVVPLVRELAPIVPVSVDTFHARGRPRRDRCGRGRHQRHDRHPRPAMADVVADSDARRGRRAQPRRAADPVPRTRTTTTSSPRSATSCANASSSRSARGHSAGADHHRPRSRPQQEHAALARADAPVGEIDRARGSAAGGAVEQGLHR